MIRIRLRAPQWIATALAAGMAAGVAAGAPAPPPALVPLDPDTGCREGDVACHEVMYQLGETLFAYELAVAAGLEAAASECWRAAGEAFRRTVASCPDRACREAALRERLAGLHFLQPADGRADIALPPEAPQLLAVLAPEPAEGNDGSSLPASPGAATFEARGALVHASEHPEHMGIAVRGSDGADHVFLFDMQIGGGHGHDELLGLVGASPTARMLVRGRRKDTPEGAANFDTAQCRIVYQLP
ncbi:hypothetical protein QFW77_11935 [Luteimonas sp. RD2P54]|uniref:Uncharacterized protein n=1 Tax=Luteimonas endophytica TaxID=3042023 RepID=A0ABT6JA38_9GAMM|nr:hypothetical protein [Luteimonas endophytica]MDH5823697.1 hypothetical protein [Luteimonas endophytica]